MSTESNITVPVNPAGGYMVEYDKAAADPVRVDNGDDVVSQFHPEVADAAGGFSDDELAVAKRFLDAANEMHCCNTQCRAHGRPTTRAIPDYYTLVEQLPRIGEVMRQFPDDFQQQVYDDLYCALTNLDPAGDAERGG